MLRRWNISWAIVRVHQSIKPSLDLRNPRGGRNSTVFRTRQVHSAWKACALCVAVSARRTLEDYFVRAEFLLGRVLARRFSRVLYRDDTNTHRFTA